MKYESISFVRTMRRSLRLRKSRSVTFSPCVNYKYVKNINNNDIPMEYSFVNSQEWTLSRAVPDLRLGIVGSLSSGKSALVHRYLTGSYMQEESPEGGRFKKEIMLDGQSHLLLIRDEGGPPELQFTAWVDAVIFVFSLENESSFNAIYNYYAKMAHFRNTGEVPLILVGTQDAISENNPRVIDDGRARKLASDLKRCSYYETCATYGLNVERVFHDACSKIVSQRLQQGFTPTNSRPSTPTHLIRYPSVNNGLGPAPSFPSSLPVSQGMECTLRSTYSNGAELTAMTRTDSFRDDSFKRVSAPSAVTPAMFVAPLPPPTGNTPGHLDTLPVRDTNAKDLPTPSSTPTTSRKSRRKSNLFTPSKKNEDRKNGEVGSGRAIPIKQGYLYKKSNKTLNKDWKKKYVTLGDDHILTYHANINDYMVDSHSKEISLQYTTVKVPGMKPRGSRVVGSDPLMSELNSLNLASTGTVGNSNMPMTGRPSLGGQNPLSKEKVTLTSYEALHETQSVNGLENANNHSSKLETPNVKKRHRRIKSSGLKNSECEDSDGYEFSIVSLDNKQWFFEAVSQEERDEWVTAIEQQILLSLQGNESNKSRTRQAIVDPQAIVTLKLHVPGNTSCADCDTPNPEWASINLGILMCIECSGIHRNLGSHITKVRSLDLDEWPPGHLAVMRAIGNDFANNIWEGRTHGQPKPEPKSIRDEKEKWIRRKYENKEFLNMPMSSVNLHKQMVECTCRGDVRSLSALVPHARDLINAPLDSRDQRTLLHLAAGLPSLSCTQLLIWNNANVKAVDSDARSCLYYARLSGSKDVVDLLIQSGCPESGTAAIPIQGGPVLNPNCQQTPLGPNSLLSCPQPSTLPRRKGSIGRKTDKLV